jgi:hypothetical protein
MVHLSFKVEVKQEQKPFRLPPPPPPQQQQQQQ